MDILRERDLDSDDEIQSSDEDHMLRKSDSNKQIQPLDVSVLIHCGQLVSDYFKSFMENEIEDDDEDYITVNSCSSVTDFSETYMDMAMSQTFDWLYDTMSQDMEKADDGYQTQRKLKFYDDLGDFVRYHNKLHEINRSEKYWVMIVNLIMGEMRKRFFSVFKPYLYFNYTVFIQHEDSCSLRKHQIDFFTFYGVRNGRNLPLLFCFIKHQYLYTHFNEDGNIKV